MKPNIPEIVGSPLLEWRKHRLHVSIGLKLPPDINGHRVTPSVGHKTQSVHSGRYDKVFEETLDNEITFQIFSVRAGPPEELSDPLVLTLSVPAKPPPWYFSMWAKVKSAGRQLKEYAKPLLIALGIMILLSVCVFLFGGCVVNKATKILHSEFTEKSDEPPEKEASESSPPVDPLARPTKEKSVTPEPGSPPTSPIEVGPTNKPLGAQTPPLPVETSLTNSLHKTKLVEVKGTNGSVVTVNIPAQGLVIQPGGVFAVAGGNIGPIDVSPEGDHIGFGKKKTTQGFDLKPGQNKTLVIRPKQSVHIQTERDWDLDRDVLSGTSNDIQQMYDYQSDPVYDGDNRLVCSVLTLLNTGEEDVVIKFTWSKKNQN